MSDHEFHPEEFARRRPRRLGPTTDRDDLEFRPEQFSRPRPSRLEPTSGREDLEFSPADYVRPRPRNRRRSGFDLQGQGSLMALGLGMLAGAAALYYLKPQQRYRRPSRYRDSAPRQARRESDERYAIAGRAVTINKPRAELYGYWKDPKNFSFMENVERVEKVGGNDRRWRWTIKAPGGRDVTVETEITEDRPNEYIAWRSTESSQIETRGHVEFRDAPGGRGTAVSAVIEYVPPGGTLGQMVAKLFQREPMIQVRHDLKRLKMLLETGEIATSQNRKSE